MNVDKSSGNEKMFPSVFSWVQTPKPSCKVDNFWVCNNPHSCLQKSGQFHHVCKSPWIIPCIRATKLLKMLPHTTLLAIIENNFSVLIYQHAICGEFVFCIIGTKLYLFLFLFFSTYLPVFFVCVTHLKYNIPQCMLQEVNPNKHLLLILISQMEHKPHDQLNSC